MCGTFRTLEPVWEDFNMFTIFSTDGVIDGLYVIKEHIRYDLLFAHRILECNNESAYTIYMHLVVYNYL